MWRACKFYLHTGWGEIFGVLSWCIHGSFTIISRSLSMRTVCDSIQPQTRFFDTLQPWRCMGIMVIMRYLWHLMISCVVSLRASSSPRVRGSSASHPYFSTSFTIWFMIMLKSIWFYDVSINGWCVDEWLEYNFPDAELLQHFFPFYLHFVFLICTNFSFKSC